MAESPIQSSFIPRDASASSAVKLPRGGLYDLLMLVSVVLFIASIVLAVGVFLYVNYLESAAASKLQQLQRAEAAFEPALIQKLTRLDDRMHAADDLLASHVAPSALLAVLEQTTLESISFKSLDFQAGDPQNMTLKMSGVARSINAVALQADLFSKSSVIADPIFSGIARQADGVVFSVGALVKPAAIRYASLIGGGAIPGARPGAGSTASTSNPNPFGGEPAAPGAQ